MIEPRHFQKKILAIALSGTFMVASLGQRAEAEIKLHRLGQALPVTLESDVSTKTSTVGDIFRAKLAEDARYKKRVLPAGTEFQGKITEIRHSRRFDRPGFVGLNVEEATLPNGETLLFSPDHYKPRQERIHHPDTYSLPEAILTQLPYNIVAGAILIPITVTSTVTPGGMFVAGEAIRMGTGAVAGLFRERFRNEPTPRKVALGAMDGSGVPRVVGFFVIYPEPDFHVGQTIKLHVHPQGMKDLLEKAQSPASPTAQAHP